MEHEAATHAAEAAHHGVDILPIVILLAAVVVAVPLFRRLGLGSVLGYLAAGLTVGPFGFGLFSDAQTIIHVAELGVVMFLFVIGLEMQPSRLWSMRGDIFGLGLAQVAVCMLLLWTVGLALGYPVAASLISGTGFVLTSTAIVMQLLEERRQMNQPSGRRIVAILLLEDLAIVPLLALVAFLAPGGEEATLAARAVAVAIGLAAITALVVAGRYLLDPMFRLLARTGSREVMTAAALLVVLGAAWLMQSAGLSMAMGAFLAGVLLSESTFRHQLEADVEPFRGILLGLFFLGVGMALDLRIVAAHAVLIAVSVAGLMVLKFAGIYGIARLFRASGAEATERAVLMAQGGEFAFVLYAAATSVGILIPEENAILTAIIIVSMALTPLMVILHGRMARDATPSMEGVEAADGLSAPVAEAQLIVWAADDRERAVKFAEIARAEFPLTPVLVRAADREHALDLVHAGATFQMRELLGSALATGEEALRRLGVADAEIAATMAECRSRDAERFATELVGGIYAGRGFIRGNIGADPV